MTAPDEPDDPILVTRKAERLPLRAGTLRRSCAAKAGGSLTEGEEREMERVHCRYSTKSPPVEAAQNTLRLKRETDLSTLFHKQ